MTFPILCSLLALAAFALIYCQRAGAQHQEKCRRKEAESRLRALQQNFFTAQKELIKAKKENLRLTELDSDRCRTIGQIAHELRNPINALDSVFNLLEVELKGNHTPSPAVFQSLFGLAADALASMQIQVQKVDDARSDQVALERTTRSPIELNALLRQVISLNEIQASQKGIELRLIGDSRPRIWADQNSCHTIVDRLIRTTVERSPAGSVICLQIENPQMNEVAFSIETKDQPLLALVTQFLENPKNDTASPTTGSKPTELVRDLADTCKDIEAQGGTLQTREGKRLTLRFPHVRLLTRNPFFEINETAPEAALQALPV
jgi:signal transduction histidine kinase|tara:strand:- start:341 stop:1303 length:963 start_codon:yes stop_codon:yes gene_type:complete